MNLTNTSRKKKTFYANAHWYFILALIIVITGFYQSYFNALKQTDIYHHLHGIAAFTWMLLLIIQPLLFTKKKMKWHRWLGWTSIVVVAVFSLSALKMIQVMIFKKANYPPMVVYQLSFLDFTILIFFIVFFSLALIKRKQIHYHARYMASTVFVFVLPALTRALFLIPFINTFKTDLNVGYAMAEIALTILIIDEKRSGKIYSPYVVTLAFFILQHIIVNYVAGFTWWRALMDSYSSM